MSNGVPESDIPYNGKLVNARSLIGFDSIYYIPSTNNPPKRWRIKTIFGHMVEYVFNNGWVYCPLNNEIFNVGLDQFTKVDLDNYDYEKETLLNSLPAFDNPGSGITPLNDDIGTFEPYFSGRNFRIHKITDSDKKAQWLEALRSGKYGQTTSRLKNERCEYCCLGVFAEITGILESKDNYWFYVEVGDSKDDETLGHNNRYITRDTQLFLANLNDHGFSFKAIADFIEKYL